MQEDTTRREGHRTPQQTQATPTNPQTPLPPVQFRRAAPLGVVRDVIRRISFGRGIEEWQGKDGKQRTLGTRWEEEEEEEGGGGGGDTHTYADHHWSLGASGIVLE